VRESAHNRHLFSANRNRQQTSALVAYDRHFGNISLVRPNTRDVGSCTRADERSYRRRRYPVRSFDTICTLVRLEYWLAAITVNGLTGSCAVRFASFHCLRPGRPFCWARGDSAGDPASGGRVSKSCTLVLVGEAVTISCAFAGAVALCFAKRLCSAHSPNGHTHHTC